MLNNYVQEGAVANVVVKLGLIKLLTKDFDLCEEAYVSPPSNELSEHDQEYLL